MVSFTCNNCGESVKKNRVEKHYSTECRRKSGGPNVCCIDCLKDFRQDYEAHTSCQTEDERYAAKGTFVAKESKNKQLKKQMTWSEIIQSVSNSNDLSLSYKDIFNVIKESDNVPRKEAKFKNFCKNNGHLRRFNEKDIMGVFNLIQNELKKNTEAVKLEREQALAAAKNKDNTDTPLAMKRSISGADEDNDESVQSKKIKSSETDESIIEESCKEKKKKGKKNKSNDNDVDMLTVLNGKHDSKLNGLDANVDKSTTNGKKEKKKSKKTSLDTSSSEIEVQENCDKPYNINGSVETNGIDASGDNNLTNGHTKSKKKKKKHSISDTVTDEVKVDEDTSKLAEGGNDTSLTSKSPKKKRKSTEPEKTPFKEIIAKLLKPGTELKLKSLKKMVFAVYKSGEEEVPREVRENFNKKLSKIPNVEINEKIVKMVK